MSPAAPTTIGFFQWRQSRAGSEKFHSALVPARGPGLGAVPRGLPARRDRRAAGRGARQPGGVAGRPALGLPGRMGRRPARACRRRGSTTPTVADTVHRLLRARGVTRRRRAPVAALDAYRLVVVPTLYLVTDEHAARIADAAEARRAGRSSPSSPGSPTRTTTFGSVATRAPSATSSASASRSSSRSPGRDGRASTAAARHRRLERGRSRQRRRGARPRMPSGPLAGRPAVTRRDVGAGGAWYLGTLPDDAPSTRCSATCWTRPGACRSAGLPPASRSSAGAPGTPAGSSSLNHTDDELRVAVAGHDLVADAATSTRPCGWLAGEVAVVREW